VFANYSWSPTDRNGFPDGDMVPNIANTLRDGAFKLAR
jgi:hypothetical protein